MITEILTGLDRLAATEPVALTVEPRPYEAGRTLFPLQTGEEFVPTWDPDTAYDEILAKCAMVDRCVFGPAEKAASLPLRVWERSGASGKPTLVESHPLEEVLNNPRTDPVLGSREELVTRTIAHQRLVGTALTGIVRAVDIRNGGERTPAELVAEDPREVYPIPEPGLKIAQWNYRDGDGQTFAWERDALVCWKRHNPRNAIWGRSVLESLALNVDTIVGSSETRLLRVKRDGKPGMIISDPAILDAKDGQEKERMLNARQRSNRGGILLLGGEQSLVAAGMPDKDLGLLANEAFDRDMIAIAFGFLPAGFSNDASTYANSGIFVLHEWSQVQALMSSWCNQLGAFLFSPEDRRRLTIAPDYSEVQALQDASMEKLRLLSEAAFKGLSTNELISALGLPIPTRPGEGDVVLVPAKLKRLSQVMEGVGQA